MKLEHNEQREKDIQILCNQIVNMSVETYYNPGGANTSTCPLCYSRVEYAEADIKDIKHDLNCGYLIAKDLLI